MRFTLTITRAITLITMITAFTCINTATAITQSSDHEKEARWADQVSDSLMDGDIHWLQQDSDHTQQRVFSLFMEAPANPGKKQAAIILHGLGIHPNWPQIIYPLRIGLPERGWTTLAVQMPVLPNENTAKDYAPLYDEAIPRLDAAKKLLHSKGYEDITLIGHSLGASMGAYYLSLPGNQSAFSGFIGIGMSATGSDIRMNEGKSLEKITLPVLDLYGSDDLDGVLKTSELRKRSANKAGNKHYQQVVVSGADHFFENRNDALLHAVLSFLQR